MTATWDDLVSTALVGTERRPLPPSVTGQVSQILDGPLPSRPAELTLLAAAGVLTAYARAGRVAQAGGEPPPPAPTDDRPLASTTAIQLLELLLSGQVRLPAPPAATAAVWLQRCGDAGRRPPDQLLPTLLAAATTDRSLRPAVRAAGGGRLGWLARRNPDWQWADLGPGPGGAGDAAEVWAMGTGAARLDLLASLRRDDPATARDLVAQTWATEDARTRATIVGIFAVGLHELDEPFLEAALDDRSKTVRQAAAAQLTRLPTSRLATRMTDRLRPLVETGGRFRKRLELTLPEELDAAARRDGLGDGEPPARLGPRAWWLTQLVAATPLSFWEREVGLDPDAVVKLAGGPELLMGLGRAAVAQRDEGWAAALVTKVKDPALLELLGPDDAGRAAASMLDATPDTELPRLLESIAGPWSERTSGAVVDRLRRVKTSFALQAALPTPSLQLHPAVAPAVERWVLELREDEGRRRQVRMLAHALTIRHTIDEEFS